MGGAQGIFVACNRDGERSDDDRVSAYFDSYDGLLIIVVEGLSCCHWAVAAFTSEALHYLH